MKDSIIEDVEASLYVRDLKLPRERLLSENVNVLNDAELLALILGSGTKKTSVFKIANTLVEVLDTFKTSDGLERLVELSGLGLAKACTLLAVIEYGRRRFKPLDMKINGPEDVFKALLHFADRKQERFIVISLNGAHEVNAIRVVSVGTLNRTLVHPRDVFADAVLDRAAGIIAAHNHPSGNLEASKEDKEITSRLFQSGEMLGIPLMDHLIFSKDGYYSLMEHGEIAM